MPNHITNILTVIEGEYNLDNIQSFSDVLPLPKELEGEDADALITSVEKALGSDAFISDKSSGAPAIDDIKQKYADDEVALARIDKAVANIKKFGHASWYLWNIENWGTKWDMYEREVSDDANCLVFQTAWSAPIQWAEAFAKTLPDGVVLKLEWADEDFGCNTGEALLSNKSFDATYHEDQSDEAYDLACEIIGNPDNLVRIDGKWTWLDDDDEDYEDEEYEDGEDD